MKYVLWKDGRVIRRKWGRSVFNDLCPHEWKSDRQLRVDAVEWLKGSLRGLRRIDPR